jgi:hypothetical protein
MTVDDVVEAIFRTLCQHHRRGLPVSALLLLLEVDG